MAGLLFTPRELSDRLDGILQFASGEAHFSEIQAIREVLELMEDQYPETLKILFHNSGCKIEKVTFTIEIVCQAKQKDVRSIVVKKLPNKE